MAASVVRKLERCERLGRASQGEAMLNGEKYQVIKHKTRIKDYLATNQIKLDRVMENKLGNLPAWRLQHLQAQATCKGSSPLPPYCSTILQEDELQLHSLQICEENESIWLHHPCKLHENVLHEHVSSNTSSPGMLQPSTVQENEEASCASSPWNLQESSNEREEEINWVPRSSPNLQQTVKERQEDPSSPWKVEKATEDVGKGEDGREEATSPSELQKAVQEKAGAGVWERVKKMECECCGMEEECTEGYEEKVRSALRGHWLCGLCEEAVGDERKRVGGSVQAALAAHMQPCRRFSRRARSKASPLPSDVALPHAVCRLLCRHLSTPSPRPATPACPSACPSPFLSRSSSCLPSLRN